MLSKRIIASDITNLTDARYFAAQGAEFLLFQMDKISVSNVVEIKEWVEGIKILLSFNPNSIDSLEESLLRILPEAIVWKGEKNNDDFEFLSPYAKIFEWTDNGLLLDNVEFYYLKELSDVNSGYCAYIISGTEEKLTGVKNYEALDELFEKL